MSNRTAKATRKQDPLVAASAAPLAPPVTVKKKWSKWLKFTGSALLLFAFGMQNQQNRQMALYAERFQAAELDSRALQKAIGYETLYYAAKASGNDQSSYLAMAAKQYFEGSMAMIVTAPGDRDEIGRNVQMLRRAAASVHDQDSLQQYKDADNKVYLQGHKNQMGGLTDPDKSAKSLGSLYFVLYGAGSLLALAGQALD
jgi:hypothetical protein